MENNDILKGQLGSYVDFLGGDSCITKNFIYYNMPMDEKQSIPVYSSSTKEQTFMGMINKLATNRGKNIKVFEGEAILVARNGQAGKMRYIPKGHEFTINDHAYVMKVKKQYRDRINLTWFMFKFQRLFYEIVIAKDANGNFNKTYANEQEIIIPSIKTQELELEKIKEIMLYKSKLVKIRKEIEKTIKKIISFDDMNTFVISDVFYLDTGKRIITKELYDNINNNINNNIDLIPIVSSGTENNGIFGYASESWLKSNFIRKRESKNVWQAWKNEPGQNYIIEENCVTWNTDGDAGEIFYRDYKFFPTDHCGVLIPKEQYKGKINLELFVYLNKYKFKQSTDRGNLHKTKMSSLTFEMPGIEKQNEIYIKINKLERYLENINKILDKINNVLEKEIISKEEIN